LVDAGHPVIVVTRRRSRESPNREIVDGVTVVRFGAPGRGRLADRVAVLRLAAWVFRRRQRILAFHTVMWTDAAITAAVVGLSRRTIVGWGALGDAPTQLGVGRPLPRRLYNELRRRLLNGAVHVALTEPMRAELRRLGVRRSVVLPIPVDIEWFRPPTVDERTRARASFDIGPSTFAVLYLGHLRALKRVDRLVDAVARLQDRVAVRLLLVGGNRGADDDVELDLRRRVANAGIDNDVIFVGVVEDPRGAIWAADVLVLPSEREGLPNSLLEAMACGVCCVAPESAAGTALLTDGAGVIPADADPVTLSDSLRELASDPTRRRRISERGRSRAAAFDVRVVAMKYVDLYLTMGKR
jgi:glycosyltransferase involved in cell wall biosynthesis